MNSISFLFVVFFLVISFLDAMSWFKLFRLRFGSNAKKQIIVSHRQLQDEETIAELLALNAILKEKISQLKNMVNEHKKEAQTAKKALLAIQSDGGSSKTIISNKELEELKNKLMATFESEKADLLKKVFNDFEKEKKLLIQELQIKHNDEIKSVRESLLKEIDNQRNDLKGIQVLKKQLLHEQKKLESKTNELNEYRDRQIIATRDIEELRKALSLSVTSVSSSQSKQNQTASTKKIKSAAKNETKTSGSESIQSRPAKKTNINPLNSNKASKKMQ